VRLFFLRKRPKGGKMKTKTLMTTLLGVGLIGLLIDSTLWAESTPERLDAIKARLKHVKALFEKLPETRRQVLSGGGQNLLHLAEGFEKMEPGLRKASQQPRVAKALPNFASAETKDPAGAIPVSDPRTDFFFSVLAGFTQSETSTAWCGNNVMVGFNDSGSLPESLLSGPGGVSFNGVALSTDQGRSFQDLGFLNPGPNPLNFLGGDPVLGCANASTFYYASIFLTGSVSNPVSAISVSRTLGGGSNFGNPVVAAGKDAFTHFLDKPWMTIDPTNPNRIFVTYTDFDFSGDCGSDSLRTAIELVRSTNGGTSWSAPVPIEEVCTPFIEPAGFPQGSQVAVGPGGTVYVAWEFFQADFITREQRIRRSTNHGASFSPFVKVDDVIPVGDGFGLQGGFLSASEFPSLAVDRSGAATNGNVYVAWHDGRNLQVPDFFSSSGFYGYADVLISRSSDGGASWSAPIRVNTNDEPLSGRRGTDQYQPGAAVDKTGKVAVCWYDRRKDSSNFLIDRFCGVSTDAGVTWSNRRHSSPSWAPIHATDVVINPFYLGDYDSLASDFTRAIPGFIGTFQFIDSRRGILGKVESPQELEQPELQVLVPNPDVKATRFQ
jgi:hypothetical protein